MKINCVVILTVVSIQPSPAFADAVAISGTYLKLCYHSAAARYGSFKCDPPASLLAAVYGNCADLEEYAKKTMVRENSDVTVSMQAAVIDRVRAAFAPQIQSWILDAQIASGMCQPPKNSN